MDQEARISKFRHALGNSLAAVLAETQLLLMTDGDLGPEAIAALNNIEGQALKMRAILEEDRNLSRQRSAGS